MNTKAFTNPVKYNPDLESESYKEFSPSHRPGQRFVQYDYRHTNGELFSCVAATLNKCRVKRDNWLSKK